MHRFVVDVGAATLRDVEAITLRFRPLSKMFLFIANVVLGAGHHAGILNTLNCRCNQSAGQIGIRREAFLQQSQQRPTFDLDSKLPSFYHLQGCDQEGRTRAQAGRRLLYRGALHPLLDHVHMPVLCSMLQQCSYRQKIRNCSRLLDVRKPNSCAPQSRTISDTQWRVLKTQAPYAEPRYRTCLPNASLAFPAVTRISKVHLTPNLCLTQHQL